MKLPPFTKIVYVGLVGSVVGGFVGMYFAEGWVEEARKREDAKLWAEIEQDRKRAAAQRAAATNPTLHRPSEQQQQQQ